ncbi:MAG: S8 family serine peptidase [Thermodesulfobacteriota bacterium]
MVLLLFSSIGHAHTVTSNANPAAPNRAVKFTSKVSFVTTVGSSINVYIDYGDGTAEEELGNDINIPPSNTRTFSSTHTYSKPGTYKVRLRTTGGTPAGANPAYMTQQVSGLDITRVELYFENQRPEITVKRHQEAPELFAKVNFSGKGYFKAYWEVDGKKQGYVFRYLSAGPHETFSYPAIPPLPTFNYGSHRVRFIITTPGIHIDHPYAVYFVTADEAEKRLAEIKLLKPSEGETVAPGDLAFQWEPEKKSSLYLLSLFSKEKRERVFSAYTRQREYTLKSEILKNRMKQDEQYLWHVTGFNDEDEAVSESTPFSFLLERETPFVKGRILFVTEADASGEKSVGRVKQKYGFTEIESFLIKTLGLKVTKFEVETEVPHAVEKLSGEKGAVGVYPDYIFRTMTEPMEDLQGIRKTIQTPDDLPFKGRNVAIGIIDTGVDAKHRDLADAVVSSTNWIEDSEYEPEIHGTGVAGLIGARKNNFGIQGFAPESKIFALRACRQVSLKQPGGECYTSSIVKALDFALQNDVRIINMSLGTNVQDKLVTELIDAGAEQGILFVAPAGNDSGQKKLFFPACHPRVISVAGINEAGEFFPNQRVAEKADFYLPYQNLFSTAPGDRHNFFSGTSFSGSIVTGILALACENDKGMAKKDLPPFTGDMTGWTSDYFMHKSMAAGKNE